MNVVYCNDVQHLRSPSRRRKLNGMRAMILVLMVAACGSVDGAMAPPHPVANGVEVEEVDTPADAAAAIAAISDFYAATLGVDPREAPVAIHWAATMPGTYLGLTSHAASYGCSSWIIQGAMWSYPKVLPHEIGHCVRWMLTGDGDSEHTDSTWWDHGGYVEQALAAEVAAGIYH